MSNSDNPNKLYEIASKEKHSKYRFWGSVPRSFEDAVDMAINDFEYGKYRSENDVDDSIGVLKEILTEYHKKLGIYSPKVEEHIKLLDRGSILMGQQPIVFGGPGFIANKLGCLILLSDLAKQKGKPLAPVFFIGDYDGLQKELARQYFPNPNSHHALILDSEDYLPEDSNIAAHAAKLPPQSWLNNSLEILEENMKAFQSLIKGNKKKLLQERWDHIRTTLKLSYTGTETLSEWGTKIWGTLSNIASDYGIIFLPTSHPKIRKLVAQEYFPFIEKRKLYTEKFQKATDEVKNFGVMPTLPHRHEDYAPFTLECGSDHNRMTTSIVEKEGKVYVEGECPECDGVSSHEVTDPQDLDKIATRIGPRVDTSQAVFQHLMNIRVRISGPGEIAYYAQAAPAVKSIGFPLPIFVKYKRAFYNAEWIEHLGKQLQKRNQGSLQQGSLFKILRERMNAEKNEDYDGIRDAEEDMKQFILDQYKELLQHENSSDVQKYLGWQFGRFTKDKFAQEVSWVWFDMALQTGITDYIDTYNRMYTKHSSIGGYFFINCLL